MLMRGFIGMFASVGVRMDMCMAVRAISSLVMRHAVHRTKRLRQQQGGGQPTGKQQLNSFVRQEHSGRLFT